MNTSRGMRGRLEFFALFVCRAPDGTVCALDYRDIPDSVVNGSLPHTGPDGWARFGDAEEPPSVEELRAAFKRFAAEPKADEVEAA